jgi:thiamine kinase-like enzyme
MALCYDVIPIKLSINRIGEIIMKRFFLLFIIATTFFANTCYTEAYTNGILRPTTLVAKANEQIVDVSDGTYTLVEVIGNVSEVFKQPIQEALATASAKDDIDNIKLKPLLGGLSKSKLFQFDVKGKRYVLRILDEMKDVEKRKAEVAGHSIAAGLGIAPELFYVDSMSLVIVMEFIDGRLFSRDDLNNEVVVREVLHTVKRFHDYSGDRRLLRERTTIELIQNIYKKHSAQGTVYPSCFEGLLENLDQEAVAIYENTKCVPLHGDLNHNNIIITKDGKVYLIDWSEARMDHRFSDIGWMSCFLGAEKEDIRNLLEGYFGREPSQNEIEEALFFNDATILLAAAAWMHCQEERNQEKLDILLEEPLKKGTQYVKEGITTQEVNALEGIDATKYALGWLKEFIENQS